MSFAVADDAVTKAFQNLGNEWALVAVGDKQGFNAMTISWGSLGFIWQRPVVTVLVRQSRYTRTFTEKFDNFSVSFFDRSYRKALSLLGTKSGRDTDKIAQSGLTPTFVDEVPTFQEAYLTVLVRKLYRSPMESAGFLVPAIEQEFYSDKDYHTIYFAEITKVLGKK